jgi:hypothetical protein
MPAGEVTCCWHISDRKKYVALNRRLDISPARLRDG